MPVFAYIVLEVLIAPLAVIVLAVVSAPEKYPVPATCSLYEGFDVPIPTFPEFVIERFVPAVLNVIPK